MNNLIDIKLREGNSNNFKGYFNIGLLSAQAGIEGPIVKNKSSFILSARRTYFDLFPKVYNLFSSKNDAMKSSWAYYFYDVTCVFWSAYATLIKEINRFCYGQYRNLGYRYHCSFRARLHFWFKSEST